MALEIYALCHDEQLTLDETRVPILIWGQASSLMSYDFPVRGIHRVIISFGFFIFVTT